MDFTFVNSTVEPSLWIKKFRESIKVKSPSLSGSDIVGETFLKSLSIHVYNESRNSKILRFRAGWKFYLSQNDAYANGHKITLTFPIKDCLRP